MRRVFSLRVVLLSALALGLILVAAFFSPERSELPYSSYSAEPDGTKAAYLLLEELGFRAARKSGADWHGEGIVLALGSDYLPVSEAALVVPDESRFTNSNIRDNAREFVSLLKPYYETVIVFDEYNRSPVPINAAEGDPLSLSDITPLWLKIFLLSLAMSLLTVLFFYRRRVGEPALPEGFSRREPLEGVYAMAAEMGKAGVFRDCTAGYYEYRTRKSAKWDGEGHFKYAAANVSAEREAVSLMSKIDEKIEEYEHERK